MSTIIGTAAWPRPIVCVVDDLHRDLAVADAAVAGRFTHAGVTLHLGRRPDWRGSGLAHDTEWRLEWVKLYEGLDLAHAYEVTRDAAYLDAWEDLLDSFCDQVPVGEDSSDVSARRMQNWLYAWQRFAAAGAPRLRPGLAVRVRERLLADAEHLAGHLTAERNHRTLELYALLLVRLAVDDGAAGAETVLDLLAQNAARDIWDDGVHRECSTDYHLVVLRSFVGAIANARAAGLTVPPVLLDRTHRACDFALHVQRPDGTTPALSDGDEGDYRTFLAYAGALLDRPDLMWAATAGTHGTPPRSRQVTFPIGGYCVQRSGWGDGDRAYGDERYCVIDCGPLGDGGHGHYDHLSIEAAAAGKPLVVDPGRFTYAPEDPWRRWFKGTAAHNTVCVDGLDQTPFRAGKPHGPRSTARLRARTTRPGLDVVVADTHSPSYEAAHTRVVAFVAGDYWVVHDRLRGTRPHRYEARWHLPAEAWGRTTVVPAGGHVEVRAPSVVLAVPHGHGDVTVSDGWVSPTYGSKRRAPIAVVTWPGEADADIVTLIAPADGTARAITAATDGARMRVEVRRSTGVDRLWWDAGPPYGAGTEGEAS